MPTFGWRPLITGGASTSATSEVQVQGPDKCSRGVDLQAELVSVIKMAKEGPEPSKEKDKDKEKYLLWDCAVDPLGDVWMKVYDDVSQTIKPISDEDFFGFVNGARTVVCALASLAHVAPRTDWQGFGRCLMMLGTNHPLLTVFWRCVVFTLMRSAE
jgi:hypothetical protein